MAGGISPGGDSLEHLARGQIAIGAFHQGADSLEHLVRGQMAGGISPGGRQLETHYLGADS